MGVDDIWRFCLQSKDQLWHYALYDFLISSDIHRKRLTRLDTPFIQNWFDYAAHVAPETNAMLYAEWLEAVQRYSDAAKTLYKLAILDSSMDSEFDLVKRIQILCKALTDAKASSNSELVEQISDRLDVAELQQVIVRILKSKCEADPELLGEYAQGLQVAQKKLISLSDLYRAFGEAQNMPEIQLLVLHCAGQGNAEIIEHLWRTSIDQCLHDDQGWKFDCGDAEACVSSIREKVLFLSRTFLTSRSSAQNIEGLRRTSNYIPLKTIILYLEQLTAQFNWYHTERSWVGDMFASISGYRIGGKCLFNNNVIDVDRNSCVDGKWISNAMISTKELLDVYHQIYNQRDPFWASQIEQPYYILFSICDLIHKIAVVPIRNNNNEGNLATLSTDEKSMMSHSLDLLSSYLIDLSSITSPNDMEKQTIANMKKLKSTIEFCGISSHNFV